MEILKIFRGDIDFLSEGCRIYKFRVLAPFWEVPCAIDFLLDGQWIAKKIFWIFTNLWPMASGMEKP